MRRPKTRSVRVSKVHLERAIKAKNKNGWDGWDVTRSCILGQALHLKEGDQVWFDGARIGGVNYSFVDPNLAYKLQKDFIWNSPKLLENQLPVTIKLVPVL